MFNKFVDFLDRHEPKTVGVFLFAFVAPIVICVLLVTWAVSLLTGGR